MTLPTLRRQAGLLMELRTPLAERENRQNQSSHRGCTRNSTRFKGKSQSSLAPENRSFNTRSATKNRGNTTTGQSSEEKENTTTTTCTTTTAAITPGGNLSRLTRSKRKTAVACFSTDQKRNCTSGQDGTSAGLPPLAPNAVENIPSLEVIHIIDSPMLQKPDSQPLSLPENVAEKSQALELVDYNQRLNRDLDSCSHPEEEDPVAKSDHDLQLELLNNAYDKLYKKHQNLKTRKFDVLKKAFEDQDSRTTTFLKAAEARVECLEKENRSLRAQLGEAKIADIMNRFRSLERDYADCQNEVVLERAKNLALEDRVKKLETVLMKQSALLGNQYAEECAKDFESEQKKALEQNGTVEDELINNSLKIGVGGQKKSPSQQSSLGVVDTVVHAAKNCNDWRNDGDDDTRSVRFFMGGDPQVVVLDGVKKFCNGLTDAVAFMLKHPLIHLTCMCTISPSEGQHCDVEKGPFLEKQLLLPPDTSLEPVKTRSEICAIEEVEGKDSKLKLLQDLMENLVGMQLEFAGGTHDGPSSSSSSSSSVQFLHRPTGFCFRLRRHCPHENSSEEQLTYELVSLGTLCRKATSWMKEEEIIFGMPHLQLFFKKLHHVANCSST